MLQIRWIRQDGKEITHELLENLCLLLNNIFPLAVFKKFDTKLRTGPVLFLTLRNDPDCWLNLTFAISSEGSFLKILQQEGEDDEYLFACLSNVLYENGYVQIS